MVSRGHRITTETLDTNDRRGDLSADDKKAYIKAVLCVTASPSKLDPAKVPGAKTRFDDFVAVHINQTMSIHGTVSSAYSSRCDELRFLIVVARATSCHGIVISPGLMSRCFATSVDIPVLSL